MVVRTSFTKIISSLDISEFRHYQNRYSSITHHNYYHFNSNSYPMLDHEVLLEFLWIEDENTDE